MSQRGILFFIRYLLIGVACVAVALAITFGIDRFGKSSSTAHSVGAWHGGPVSPPTADPSVFAPVTVIPQRFPTIQDAPFVSADEAGELVHEQELVIGITIGDEARAYPINMLTGPSREIINDTLADEPIAATW